MKCPKCDHEQRSEIECEMCGIIFEKYTKMLERLEHPVTTLSDRSPSLASGIRMPRWFNGVISIAIVLGSLSVAFHLGIRPDTSELAAVPPPEPPSFSGIEKQLHIFKQPGNAIETSQLATVFIETPWGAGSGFFIDSSCRILTNKHVLTINEEEVNKLHQQIKFLEYAIANKNQAIEDAEGSAAYIDDIMLDMEYSQYIEEQKKITDSLTLQYVELKSRLTAIEENRDDPTYTVILFDDSTYTVAGATFSENHDLALLQLNQDDCPCLKTGKSEALKIGQPVFTIGNPLGLSHTVTSGIISGRRTDEESTYLQTDAPINPGNSGGPLIDETGHVVGINTMILQDTEGIGFAIPIETAMNEFEELKK